MANPKHELAKLKREAYLKIEAQHGRNLTKSRIRELMKHAGYDVTLSWADFIRKKLRIERGEFKPRGPRVKNKQQVLLPKVDPFQTAAGHMLAAMKSRSIKRVVLHDDGKVVVESVDTFTI